MLLPGQKSFCVFCCYETALDRALQWLLLTKNQKKPTSLRHDYQKVETICGDQMHLQGQDN